MKTPLPEPQRSISPDQIAQELSERFGAECVELGEEARVTASPHDLVELSEMLGFASSNRWRVVPIGAGSWLEMGNKVLEAHLYISTSRMTRVIEYEPADLTATVEAGCTLAGFNANSATHRQFIPLDPFGDPNANLGAIVATASYGPLRCAFGTPRDWVIGMRVAHADGKITKAGGKVVKNVAGYDMCKLYTGSYGTLGIIGELSFKLRALPPTERTVAFTSGNILDLCSFASRISDSDLQPAAMEIFSPHSIGAGGVIDSEYALALRFLDEVETIDAQVEDLKQLQTQSSGEMMIAVLDEAGASEMWRNYREHETSQEWAWALRVNVLPSDVAAMISEIQSLIPSSVLKIHAANGVIRVFAGSESMDQLKTAQRPRKIAELRQSARDRGGSLVIIRAPDAIRDKLDVWGEPGPQARLMREIKAKFDPQSILNPGRFAAGI